AKSIHKNENGEIEVEFEVKGKTETALSELVLMAVGRAPQVDGLGLEDAGVEFSQKGITVNDDMQTNVEGIFAVGDVNGRMMLAHVASFQGEHALNVIQNRKEEINFNIVPSAVFTVPECGMVGKTEEQCKAEGMSIKIGQSFFRANGKALALGEPEGLCKLIFDKTTDRLIGAHIMGVEAADLAQQCADMICRETTLSQLRDIIFGHPTVSEVIMSAARGVK
ncbi:MAG: FAD-dependent oxidoreductase, partial [Muribaculaceae bacterium]|nr:FAD-dependent oxidoreductase [Muribaculaceae bacterium]